MKKALLFFCMMLLPACGLANLFNRKYVRDYDERIELVKRNFPEIYDLYCRGAIILDDVYTYEKNGVERVGINYHYR